MGVELLGDFFGVWLIGLEGIFLRFLRFLLPKIVKFNNMGTQAWDYYGEGNEKNET